jgi:hypothetical protein
LVATPGGEESCNGPVGAARQRQEAAFGQFVRAALAEGRLGGGSVGGWPGADRQGIDPTATLDTLRSGQPAVSKASVTQAAQRPAGLGSARR